MFNWLQIAAGAALGAIVAAGPLLHARKGRWPSGGGRSSARAIRKDPPGKERYQ